MLDMTMKKMSEVIECMNKEVGEILKFKTLKGKTTTIKIKKGSKVIINNAYCILKQDAVVETNDPNTLMK